jgi:predicted DNA-binding protein
MSTMNNRKIPLTAKVAPETVANLDYVAKHLGVTKSALVSRLIESGINDYLEAAQNIAAGQDLLRECRKAVAAGFMTEITEGS